MLLVFGIVGCDGILTGIGIGVAGSETLDSWEENLEAKRIELDRAYDEAITSLEAATDPNELAFHRKKVQEIQLAKTANLGALAVVQEIKLSPGQARGEGGYLNLLHGLIPIAVAYAGIEVRKRLGSEKKWKAEQHGRELALREIAAMPESKITAPAVKKIMYKDIGDALKA